MAESQLIDLQMAEEILPNNELEKLQSYDNDVSNKETDASHDILNEIDNDKDSNIEKENNIKEKDCVLSSNNDSEDVTSNENELSINENENENLSKEVGTGSFKDLLPDISSLIENDNDLAALTADITAALQNNKSSDLDFNKDNPLDILYLCTTTAQQLKDTINEVLKSRERPKEDSSSEVSQSNFADNIKEKIAELEEAFVSSKTKEKDENQKCNSEVPVKRLPSQQHPNDASANIQNMPLIENDNNENREKEKLMNPADDQNENVEKSTTSTVTKSVVQQKLLSSTSDNSETKFNNIQQTSDIQDVQAHKKLAKGTNSSKRKGEKTIDQVTKFLANYGSTEEKFQALYKKHVEVLDDQRNMESRLKQSDRYNIQLTREKEQLQSDHNRAVLAKSKLESLCRELQRQNKAIKEESLIRIREEEEKRKELIGKFQTTLNDISTLMQENQQRSSQLKDENIELAQKLKSLVDHYDMWEKHMGKVIRQKDLESQLAKAKLAKALIQMKQERENFLKEKHQLLENISELQKRSTELATTELQLRNELSLYTSKYDEFQGVLRKSNDVFSSFKSDMESMSKKIKKLQKETGQWKTRWENSNRALIEMAAEKQKRDQELLTAHQRILTLEKLCRALQTERIEFQNQLKVQHQNNVIPNSIPVEQLENTEEILVEEPLVLNENSKITNDDNQL